jgi:hypothetical protein
MLSEFDLRVLDGQCSANLCAIVRRSIIENQNAHVDIALTDDTLNTSAKIPAVSIARDHHVYGWN